eukprot:GAHX01000203.1.p1 GENE.GAHX01000203.1~~GAHX01000203.1.p1  ORF type:complete len:187 (+),score=23.98 GAHX01000203.1:309-869(+)
MKDSTIFKTQQSFKHSFVKIVIISIILIFILLTFIAVGLIQTGHIIEQKNHQKEVAKNINTPDVEQASAQSSEEPVKHSPTLQQEEERPKMPKPKIASPSKHRLRKQYTIQPRKNRSKRETSLLRSNTTDMAKYVRNMNNGDVSELSKYDLESILEGMENRDSTVDEFMDTSRNESSSNPLNDTAI